MRKLGAVLTILILTSLLVPAVGAQENTLTCGAINHYFALDTYGRAHIRWLVEAINQNGVPVPLVSVDAYLTKPNGPPVLKLDKLTHLNGFARFPWGAAWSWPGTWTIDVADMTLEGYTFIDDEEDCSASAYGPQ